MEGSAEGAIFYYSIRPVNYFVTAVKDFTLPVNYLTGPVYYFVAAVKDFTLPVNYLTVPVYYFAAPVKDFSLLLNYLTGLLYHFPASVKGFTLIYSYGYRKTARLCFKWDNNLCIYRTKKLLIYIDQFRL